MRRMQMEELIVRWKKTTRALKKPEQEHGRYFTNLLDNLTDAELAFFSDPVEAAAFFCLLDMAQRTGIGDAAHAPDQHRLPL